MHLKLKCFKMSKVKLMLQLNRLLFLSQHLHALSLWELSEKRNQFTGYDCFYFRRIQ